MSFTRLKNALAVNGLSLDCVKAVFVTHEHSDHVKGLDMLTKKTRIPVFAQGITLEGLLDKGVLHGEYYEVKGGGNCGMHNFWNVCV